MLGYISPVKTQGISIEIMTEIINKETISLIVSIQILLFDHAVLYAQVLFIHISFPAMTCYYTTFSQILLLMGQLHTLW